MTNQSLDLKKSDLLIALEECFRLKTEKGKSSLNRKRETTILKKEHRVSMFTVKARRT